MNFRALKNQSESWKSPGNLFLKKGANPVLAQFPISMAPFSSQLISGVEITRIYELLTKREVKMAGYWSRFINWQKKEKRPIFSHLDQKNAWSIKDLLHGFWGNFSRTTQWVVLSGQDSSILPAVVANHNKQFGSSCWLMELHDKKTLASWDEKVLF